MARYKTIDTSPRFLALDLRQQLVAGTFEHALDWLVDHELDLTGFDACYRNDFNGAPAYPPGLLLKVVLFAYSRGMISSRQQGGGNDQHNATVIDPIRCDPIRCCVSNGVSYSFNDQVDR